HVMGAASLGMGIENRFLLRTGSQWTDSLDACKTSLSSKGGKTTITPKHLSILHAITLQECHVFERYRVTITLMNLNQATTARLTLALHLLISKVNSNSLLC